MSRGGVVDRGNAGFEEDREDEPMSNGEQSPSDKHAPTPQTDAATYAGWIKVDDGTKSPWHTDRQEWTKAVVARQLEHDVFRLEGEAERRALRIYDLERELAGEKRLNAGLIEGIAKHKAEIERLSAPSAASTPTRKSRCGLSDCELNGCMKEPCHADSPGWAWGNRPSYAPRSSELTCAHGVIGYCEPCALRDPGERPNADDMRIQCPKCERPVNYVACPYCGADQDASESHATTLVTEAHAAADVMEFFARNRATVGTQVPSISELHEWAALLRRLAPASATRGRDG